MDFSHRSQFREPLSTKGCAEECRDCSTFPAPFRRVGEAAHCYFSPLQLRAGEEIDFSADQIVRFVFVLSGELSLRHEASRVDVGTLQCLCVGPGRHFVAFAQHDTQAVVLTLVQHIGFCEQDIFGDTMPPDTERFTEAVPVLPIHQNLQRLLSDLFAIRELNNCIRYHRMKAAEMFMMIRVLYSTTEQARFFRAIVHPDNDFQVFVRNNYERARGVGELAALAGMSLSVFKRHFTEQFHDSVYHWMMQQKALRILADIRDGERSTRALMNKYGFRHYTQFSRFCKNCLQATPAQLISAAGQRLQVNKKSEAPR